MKFKFNYNKQDGTWISIIGNVRLTFTKGEMEDLRRTIEIELLEADPKWHEWLKQHYEKKT